MSTDTNDNLIMSASDPIIDSDDNESYRIWKYHPYSKRPRLLYFMPSILILIFNVSVIIYEICKSDIDMIIWSISFLPIAVVLLFVSRNLLLAIPYRRSFAFAQHQNGRIYIVNYSSNDFLSYFNLSQYTTKMQQKSNFCVTSPCTNDKYLLREIADYVEKSCLLDALARKDHFYKAGTPIQRITDINVRKHYVKICFSYILYFNKEPREYTESICIDDTIHNYYTLLGTLIEYNKLTASVCPKCGNYTSTTPCPYCGCNELSTIQYSSKLPVVILKCLMFLSGIAGCIFSMIDLSSSNSLADSAIYFLAGMFLSSVFGVLNKYKNNNHIK